MEEGHKENNYPCNRLDLVRDRGKNKVDEGLSLLEYLIEVMQPIDHGVRIAIREKKKVSFGVQKLLVIVVTHSQEYIIKPL